MTGKHGSPLRSILEALDANKPKSELTLAELIDDLWRHPERYITEVAKNTEKSNGEGISSLPTVVSRKRQSGQSAK